MLQAERDHAVAERPREVAADEDRPIESFRHTLDPADQIDRRPDDSEVEPISRADIAVIDRTDVQRHDDFERWLVGHRRLVGQTPHRGERGVRRRDRVRAIPEIVAISSIGNTARMPSPMNLRISPP